MCTIPQEVDCELLLVEVLLSISHSCHLLSPGHVDVDGDAGSAVVFAHLFIPSLCLDLRPSSLSLALTLLLLA